MDTFLWSLAPVLQHAIIQEIPLKDQIDPKAFLLMILIIGDDKLFIGTQTQLLVRHGFHFIAYL